MNFNSLIAKLDEAELNARTAEDTCRLEKIKKVQHFVRHRRTKYLINVQTKKAKQLFKQGKKFMAFDIEQIRNMVNGSNQYRFQQLGVTLFSSRGIESFNYQVRGEIQRTIPFVFGKTMTADFEVIKNLVLLHANGVEAYVGHGSRNDFTCLSSLGITLPRKLGVDTCKMAYVLHGYNPKLCDLAQEYNIQGTNFHCAGNDARYTAEIFMKMING